MGGFLWRWTVSKPRKLRKPSSVASNAFKSKKWDELTSERTFTKADIPTLELLCQWHAVVQKCIDDMTVGDGIQVAYSNDYSDIKALPQVGMLKQASAEIRALNKQLGINDQPEAKQVTTEKANVLALVVGNRADKAAAAR